MSFDRYPRSSGRVVAQVGRAANADPPTIAAHQLRRRRPSSTRGCENRKMTLARLGERSLTGLAIVVACTLMIATMGRAVSLLTAALALSYGLWLTRSVWPAADRVLPAFATAVVIQSVHLVEEYRTGFFRVFPGVVGSAEWSAEQFLWFNAVCLMGFALAGIGIARGFRPAYVVALFLALGGGIGNGAGHLALAIRARGYFPGLYTAPLVLLAGTLLATRLFRQAPVSGTY